MKRRICIISLLVLSCLELAAQPDSRWVSFCPKGMDSDSLAMFFSKWERYSKKIAKHSEPCEYNNLYDSIVVNFHRRRKRSYENFKEKHVPKYMLLLPQVKVKIYHRDFPWNEDSEITASPADNAPADTTIFFTPKILEDKDIIPLYIIEPAEQAVISFMTEPVEHLEWSEARDKGFSKDKWDELEERQDMIQNYIFIRRYQWCWPCWCFPSTSTLIKEISIWNDGYYYKVNHDGRTGYTIFVYWNGNSVTLEEWLT